MRNIIIQRTPDARRESFPSSLVDFSHENCPSLRHPWQRDRIECSVGGCNCTRRSRCLLDFGRFGCSWPASPSPSLDEVRDNPQLLSSLVEVANTFAWTQGMVTAAGWLEWLRDLPLEVTSTLPDGTRFLGVHATPGRDDGHGILPDMKPTEIAELVASCNADLVCVGHTHRPSDQRSSGVHIVNLGAVSLSLAEDKYSSYVLLEARQDGYQVQHRRVLYDRSAVIDQLNEVRHPGRSYLIKHLS
jgi:diadenosine tetraphosphatase ApaH/serine/threonine PP2A family protein phosphatase